MANAEQPSRRLRVLCFHGFRTSAKILQEQLERAQWGSSVLDLLDLTFLDGTFPAQGGSDVEGKFPPPYFEWCRPNNEFTEHYGMDECFTYISDYMKLHGPFDGLLGFSQGGFLTAALAGLRAKKNLLPPALKFKFVMILAGGMFPDKAMAVAYETPIKCPSLHTIGERDFNKERGELLLTKFENPVLIRHPYSHRVPQLDEPSTAKFRAFLLEMLQETRPAEA